MKIIFILEYNWSKMKNFYYKNYKFFKSNDLNNILKAF